MGQQPAASLGSPAVNPGEKNSTDSRGVNIPEESCSPGLYTLCRAVVCKSRTAFACLLAALLENQIGLISGWQIAREMLGPAAPTRWVAGAVAGL